MRLIYAVPYVSLRDEVEEVIEKLPEDFRYVIKVSLVEDLNKDSCQGAYIIIDEADTCVKEYPVSFVYESRSWQYKGLLCLRDAARVFFLSATYDKDS